jgi:transcriptional regulator with XRE-family HTH domain
MSTLDKQQEFGQYLRNLRNIAGMSLSQVKREAKVSPAYLSQVESGQRGRPSPQFLEKLARCYRVPRDEMLRRAGYLDDQEREESYDLDELRRALEFAVSDPLIGAVLMRHAVETYQLWTGKQLLGGKPSPLSGEVKAWYENVLRTHPDLASQEDEHGGARGASQREIADSLVLRLASRIIHGPSSELPSSLSDSVDTAHDASGLPVDPEVATDSTGEVASVDRSTEERDAGLIGLPQEPQAPVE